MREDILESPASRNSVLHLVQALGLRFRAWLTFLRSKAQTLRRGPDEPADLTYGEYSVQCTGQSVTFNGPPASTKSRRSS